MARKTPEQRLQEQREREYREAQWLKQTCPDALRAIPMLVQQVEHRLKNPSPSLPAEKPLAKVGDLATWRKAHGR